MFRVFWIASLIGILAVPLSADDREPDKKSEEKKKHARWKDIYTEDAKKYDIRLDQDPITRLKMTPEPVLFYANPAGGNASHGAFFAWTHDGRAEVIGAIWSYGRGDRRSMTHSLHSLSLGPLKADHSEGPRPRWTPRVPGIELKAIANAPNPASKSTLRLAQMRRIAREFTGFKTVNEVERPMRVLGRPLYRYEPKSDKLNDGAIFGIFMDWDPEIILVIEARETSSGSRWQYAAARFSNKPLRLEHKGTEVWRFAGGNLGGPTDQYYSKHGVSFRSAVGTQD